jgi:hypothetical protein
MSCIAYKSNKNCWETKDIPCCRRENKDRCPKCIIYKLAKEEEIKIDSKDRIKL